MIDVETSGDALMSITITRHKYWRALIDGRTATLQPANLAYQALLIPAGRHHVELRYRNPLVMWSAAVSALFVIALVLHRVILSQGMAHAPMKRG